MFLLQFVTEMDKVRRHLTLDENSALVWFESLIEDFLVHFFDKLKFPDFRFFTRLCYHYSSIVIVGDYDYLPVSDILAK